MCPNTNGNAKQVEDLRFILECYKVGYDAYYRSETIYTNRENFFFVAEGIIIAATVKLITDNSSIEYLLAFFIAGAGIWISIIWYKMHEKSSTLACERMKFLKKIEKENDLPVKFFTETTREEDNLCKRVDISTWELRKKLPKVFINFWIILIIISLYLLLTSINFDASWLLAWGP